MKVTYYTLKQNKKRLKSAKYIYIVIKNYCTLEQNQKVLEIVPQHLNGLLDLIEI